MILKIITPDQNEIDQESVKYINMRLSDGYPISIYPGHTQLIALIAEGNIKLSADHQEKEFSVSEGLVTIDNDMVTCFVNWAMPFNNEKNDREQ